MGLGRPPKLRENSSHRSSGATRWGSSRGLRVTLLVCFALLGFASTYAYAGGSHAATGTTTVPNPDPPPRTTTVRPLPPPPPPPPPAQTYVAPPPPPAPFTPPRVKPHRQRVVRQHPRAKKKAAVAAAPRGGPPSPPEITQRQPEFLGPTVVPVASLSSGSSSSLLPLLLGIALGLSLVVVGVALTPPWALPRPVGIVVYEQRDQLVYGGIATALSIGLGLLITVAGL